MKLYAKSEKHFKNLDECNLQEGKILRSPKDKERYESYIMFAFRKFQSLSYHLNNTITLLNKEAESLIKEADRIADLTGKLPQSNCSRKIRTKDGLFRLTRLRAVL